MEFNITELLVAFAGGIFGAAIGALPVWILCGLAVLIGGAITMATGNESFTNLVAWGLFLGPHTAFAGGTAAAAYAAKKGELENGRDIQTALIGLNNPKVLFVGGIFGALGYLLFWLIMQVPNYSDLAWTNTIALAVILNMVITRFAFGKTGLFGKPANAQNRWVPSETGSWVPYQSKPMQLILLGIAVGVPAAYLADVLPGSVGITFGFVAFLLIFMQFGFKVPVTHHIALSASVITVVTGEVAWGVGFGILAAFLGELFACIFVYHGDTHIDPPTMALVGTFTLFPLMEQFKVFELSEYVIWLIVVGITAAGYLFLTSLKQQKLLLRLLVNKATK
ncbi:MAG: hypothetical protein MI975_21870 [Cytophagales bacterium]|nr:hypothetical protein [Cytophagales bacterium]